MEKKLDMVIAGVELLVTIGVTTLVSGALILVKPAKLGAIKKIAVGVAGVAVSCMATDKVVGYVDKYCKDTVEQFKDIFNKKPKEETVEEEA